MKYCFLRAMWVELMGEGPSEAGSPLWDAEQGPAWHFPLSQDNKANCKEP